MDKKHIKEVIRQEISRLNVMDDMGLLLSFARMKAMSMGAKGADKVITTAILEEIQVLMKQRNIMIESLDMEAGGAGFMVGVPRKTPPLVYNSKLIVKSKTKVPKAMLKKVKGKNTLHFHDLMNANEARLASK